jgi:hypothetical protein
MSQLSQGKGIYRFSIYLLNGKEYIYIYFLFFFIFIFFKKNFGTMILLERTSRTYISISSGHLLDFFQGSSYLNYLINYANHFPIIFF